MAETTLRSAKLTGDLLNPFVLFTAAFAAISFSKASPLAAVLYIAVEVLAAGASIAYLLFQRRHGKVSGFWIPRRRQRQTAGVVLLTMGVAMIVTLLALGSPGELTRMAGAMVAAGSVVAYITLFWKISIHAMAAGHAAASSLLILGVVGVLFALAAAAVVWARIASGDHSAGQAISGAAVGALAGAIFLI